jgi:hypothetical protein
MDVQSKPVDTAQIVDGLDATLDSVAIARLIQEVRSTDFKVTRAYNRTYNRHNR